MDTHGTQPWPLPRSHPVSAITESAKTAWPSRNHRPARVRGNLPDLQSSSPEPDQVGAPGAQEGQRGKSRDGLPGACTLRHEPASEQRCAQHGRGERSQPDWRPGCIDGCLLRLFHGLQHGSRIFDFRGIRLFAHGASLSPHSRHFPQRKVMYHRLSTMESDLWRRAGAGEFRTLLDVISRAAGRAVPQAGLEAQGIAAARHDHQRCDRAPWREACPVSWKR